MDRSNLVGRAAEVADVARNLADELAQSGLPEPSFEHGLPGPLQSDAPDSDALAARVKLLGLLDEFHDLLTEPALLGSPELVGGMNGIASHRIACHRIWVNIWVNIC